MNISSFSIHDKSEKDDLSPLYGLDVYRITKRDIEALLNGKLLYTDENGEYAAIIELVQEEEDDA